MLPAVETRKRRSMGQALKNSMKYEGQQKKNGFLEAKLVMCKSTEHRQAQKPEGTQCSQSNGYEAREQQETRRKNRARISEGLECPA